MSKAKVIVNKIGLPRLIVSIFLIVLLIVVAVFDLSLSMTISQCIARTGINMVLAYSMVPAIKSGIGMNFGLPLGICCGLLSGLISLEHDLTGFTGILVAWLIAIPLSLLVGLLYGMLLNKVKGSEMMVGTYMGFSIVSLMCIAWLKLPFTNGKMTWAMGDGLRTTITLEAWYDKYLNNLWSFEIFGITIPTGLLLTCAFFGLILYLFTRSKTGLSMTAAGSNPNFARLSGINPNRTRILGAMLSTMFGAVGIIVYAQGFGFYQLYSAPMNMAFPVVAAVLIGGAMASKISVLNAVLGVFLFQSILALASPVAGALFPEGNLAEVLRIIISNGVILYALTQFNGGKAR